jgi:Rieske Fe-S protein
MSDAWKKDFPITSEEESYVARREFTKFMALTSVAFFLGTFTATARKLWKRATWKSRDAVRVGHVDDVAVGGYKLFRYPTDNDPCILLRLDQERFAAFDQRCTHLSCPVYFNAKDGQLLCPCHKGIFSAVDGAILAGPSKRALDALAVIVRNGELWVQAPEVAKL